MDEGVIGDDKEVFQGKKINFDGVGGDLIQIKESSLYNNSPLKEEIKNGFLDSPLRTNINNNEINNLSQQPQKGEILNEINMAPNNYFSFFNSNINKNSNNNNSINGEIMDNNNSYLRNNIINSSLKNAQKAGCTCTKSQCKKKYCVCFSSGNYCQNCECQGCLNIQGNSNNSSIIQNGKNIQPNNKPQICCNCTKSKCNKKYCECFKLKQKCNIQCRCFGCENKNDENSNPNNTDTNINDNINNYIEKDRSKELKEVSKGYSIHILRINICKKKLFLEEKKIDLTNNKINMNITKTPKLTSKKRSRTNNNNNNSNLNTFPTTFSSSREKGIGIKNINPNVKNKKLIWN